MKKVCLYSRDERTHNLFRKSWLSAIQELGLESSNHFRLNNGLGSFGAIKNFVLNYRNNRLIFGTSEILFYSVFSRRTDIWIFTGLGRLLDGHSKVRTKLFFNLLKVVYRGQKIVVLNGEDLTTMRIHFNSNIFLLRGEGYSFSCFENIKPRTDAGLIFAYVGRLLYSKRVDIILKSFSSASAFNDKLLLFGDYDFGNLDSLSPSIIEKYIKLSRGKIILKGFLPNLKDELLNVDTVISMSRREGLPFGILDAIDCGCNIILSNVPGHTDFEFLDRVTLVNDESELSDLILNKRTLLAGLSIFDHIARRNKARDVYGIEMVVSEIKKILK